MLSLNIQYIKAYLDETGIFLHINEHLHANEFS